MHRRPIASIVALSLVALSLVALACTSAPAPSETARASAVPLPPPESATPSAATPVALRGTRIVFSRNGQGWPPPAFAIEPDGSNETAMPLGIFAPGIWSRDGQRLAIPVLVDPLSEVTAGDDGWVRPGILRPSAASVEVLDGEPGAKLNLVPVGWNSDGSRLFVMSGYDGPLTNAIGLFSVNASDGGQRQLVLAPPPGDVESGRAGTSCARPDSVNVSPDGATLLVNRISPGADCGRLLLFDATGGNMRRLNPAGTVAVDLEFWDGIERGRISEAWSPDGSRIAFGAFVLDAGASALYVATADGRDVRQIVPPNVGAVSVQWSPDGTWLVLTSKLRADPQIWRVRPDGSELERLTDGKAGATNVGAIWSPDGSKVLFQRKDQGRVTLWTMNADGTGATQLSPLPISDVYFGPYAWWPAPRP